MSHGSRIRGLTLFSLATIFIISSVDTAVMTVGGVLSTSLALLSSTGSAQLNHLSKVPEGVAEGLSYAPGLREQWKKESLAAH